MKKKGFTLVELLVVIAIIALLMGILMPALAKVRELATRVVCGSHISGLGKSAMIYTNENRGRYPRAGGRNGLWGPQLGGTAGWAQPPLTSSEILAFGPSGSGVATVSSCLYLLVKYADADSKQFVCGADSLARAFNLNDYLTQAAILQQDLTAAWDFGPNGREHYSYSYQIPFGQVGVTGRPYFPLTTTSDGSMAVMADRSPYLAVQIDPDREPYKYDGMYSPTVGSTAQVAYGGNRKTASFGNSQNHKFDGQNVLYIDGSTTFEQKPYCGVDEDNIYAMGYGNYNCKEAGIPPLSFTATDAYTHFGADNVLINDSDDALVFQMLLIDSPN